MTDEVKDAPKEVAGESKDIVTRALEEIEAKHKQEEAPKEEAPTPEEAPAEVKPIGPTIGEVLKGEERKEEAPRVVPEAPFLEIKNQNKELKKELKELKQLIEQGGTKQEVNASLLEIAEEHNVDVEFLKKLSATIKQEAKAEAEAEMTAKMRPLQDKERYDRKETIFNYHYDKTLESMPEYKDIVNKDVIKSLADLPQNANKTFNQLIEDSYGHLLKGKKSIESVSPVRQTTEEIRDVDYDRAERDTDYLKKVLADPKLKKQYNNRMVREIKI